MQNLSNPDLEIRLLEMTVTYIESRLNWEPEVFRKHIIERLQNIENMPRTTFVESIRKEGIEQGVEQGIEQGIEIGQATIRRNFIISLITNTDFDDQKIALLVGADIELVRQIRQEITPSH